MRPLSAFVSLAAVAVCCAYTLAARAEDPAPPKPLVVDVGTITANGKPIVAPGLVLDRCVDTPVAPLASQKQALTGQLDLQVVVRRGKVSLVTATTIDPGLEWLAPCVRTELASYKWPVKDAKVDVPVTVAPPPSDTDTDAAPAPAPPPGPAPAPPPAPEK